MVGAIADIFGIMAICLYVSIVIFFMFKPSKFKRSAMAILAVIIISFPSINEPIVILKLALSCGILAIFHEGELKLKIINLLDQANL